MIIGNNSTINQKAMKSGVSEGRKGTEPRDGFERSYDDKVILGQNSDNIDIMSKPLVYLLSSFSL